MDRRVAVCKLFAGLVAGILATAAYSAELTPESVRRAKSATGLVEIPEKNGKVAFGTAFCVDRSGIFVTNAHVTKKASNGAMKLILDPAGANQRVLDAKVARLADNADLALLKVENAEGLETLEIGATDQLIETAQLAAFGYPFGSALSLEKGQYPSISVNLGRITSLRQKRGELELIQLDAMLNPGNSGGPVLDMEGRVVGIVAAGLVGSGINFAIPVSHLGTLMAQPDISVKVPDVDAARQHEPHELTVHVTSFRQPAPEYGVELTLTTRSDPPRTMSAKVEGGKAVFSIVPVPPRQGPKKLRLSATFPGGSVVGQTADRDVKLDDQTLRLSEIRQIRSGEKKGATLAGGKEAGGTVSGVDQVELDLGGASATLDLGKAVSVSLEDMEKPLFSVGYKVVVKAGDKAVGETAGVISLKNASSASSAAAAGAVAPPDVASLEAESVTRSLPGPVDEVVAGGAGRYLFLHLRKLRKLAVFDVTQAKITQYLTLNSDDVLFAANAQKLLLVMRDQNVLQRYDLETLQKELSVAMPEVGQVDGLAMGYASAGPAMLMTREGPRFLDMANLALADPKTGVKDSNWRPHPQYPLQVRASADGTTFAGWEPGLSPGGIRLLTLEGDAARCRYEHTSAGVLLPSFDGNLLFTGTGIYSADLKRVLAEPLRGVTCFPSYHPAYFLGFTGNDRLSSSSNNAKPKLAIYTTADKRLLVSFTEFAELNDPKQSAGSGVSPLSIDKRVHFFPTANLLVNIPHARDQLVARRLDITAAMEKADIDYLFVASLPPAAATRGETLDYALKVKSRRGGVRYTLDNGPEGMTLSEDGKLRWAVPDSQPLGPVGVIITIKDSSGQEVLHSFTMSVRK